MGKRRARRFGKGIAVCAALAALASAGALVARSSADTGDPPEPTATDEADSGEGAWRPMKSPFEPYAISQSAEAVDDLPEDERAAMWQIAEWVETEHGYEVSQRWSAAASQTRERARAKRAARIAGTTGLEDVGVSQ